MGESSYKLRTGKLMKMKEVLYVPSLKKNLLSISTLDKKGFKVSFVDGEVLIVDEIVIDANMDLQWPHRMSLMPPSPTCSALMPYRVGLYLEAPCTQLTRSLYPQGWILMPVEDIEDPADGVEDPEDGLEDRTKVGEALDELEKH